MEIPENIQNKIDSYLWGQMSDTESVKFERKIESSDELKAQVEQIRLEHDAMNVMLDLDLSENIREWETEKVEEKATPEAKAVTMKNNSSWMRRLSAAAGVLIVIGFGALFLTGENYSDRALGKKYFNPTSFDVRAIDSAVPQFLKPAIELKDAGKFDEALTELNKFETIEDNGLIKTLTGDIHFQKGDFKSAASVFENIIEKTNSSNVKKETEMKLLMTYLADGRKADFENLKSEITESGDKARMAKIELLEKDMGSFRRWFSN